MRGLGAGRVEGLVESLGEHEAEWTLVLCAGVAVPALGHDGRVEHRERVEYLGHAELRGRHGAGVGVAERVEAFAREQGLVVAELDAGRCVARVRGPVARLEAAFLERAGAGAGVPAALEGVVEAVLGGGRPVARRRGVALRGHAPGSRRTVAALAGAYGFGPERSAAGETIGLIEFGGGFRREDLAAFCRENGLETPRVEVVGVRGGVNRPAPAQAVREMLAVVDGEIKLAAAAADEGERGLEAAQATVEVTMDLELLAALAPGARLVVYFAPPDERGMYHSLHRAIYDEVHRPSVLSMSWGEPETALGGEYMRAVDRLLLAGAHLGMTVCASSGDAGALNHSPDGRWAVNFPASSPHCLACGGTTPFYGARGGLGLEQQVEREEVWNSTHYGLHGATGGGVSRVFGVPVWQRGVGVPVGPTGRRGRGVPDVAGPADPRRGCELLVAGERFASAGTSAAAPLWAALVACGNRARGRRLGHLHAALYALGGAGGGGLRGVERGGNGGYEAGPGWNACAGWGTPDAGVLLGRLG